MYPVLNVLINKINVVIVINREHIMDDGMVSETDTKELDGECAWTWSHDIVQSLFWLVLISWYGGAADTPLWLTGALQTKCSPQSHAETTQGQWHQSDHTVHTQIPNNTSLYWLTPFTHWLRSVWGAQPLCAMVDYTLFVSHVVHLNRHVVWRERMCVSMLITLFLFQLELLVTFSVKPVYNALLRHSQGLLLFKLYNQWHANCNQLQTHDQTAIFMCYIIVPLDI